MLECFDSFIFMLSFMKRLFQVTFPTTLGVNAFRGFLNEFMHEQTKNKKSQKRSSVLQVIS